MGIKPSVMLFRVGGLQNGVTEYLIGTAVDGEKGGLGLTDVLRLLCTFIPREEPRKNEQGQFAVDQAGNTIKDIVIDHHWSFQLDKHFTDFHCVINMDNVLLTRIVNANEKLFDDYNKNIEALFNAKAEEQAQMAAEEKLAVLKDNRKNRRASAKSTPKKKKKKSGRRLASV